MFFWSPSGYEFAAARPASGSTEVLTPASIVQNFPRRLCAAAGGLTLLRHTIFPGAAVVLSDIDIR
ncbi:hypothetical protein ACQ86N_18805 [Puia sp. P3]|uniref:hypothetical protein n=1 Tax=Puia sp. P3 TaxID=3423952 RepID=UPI003D67510B